MKLARAMVQVERGDFVRECVAFVKHLRTAMSALRTALVLVTAGHARAATLELGVDHSFQGEALQMASIRYENGAHERFSITRVSYLLSDFAFQQPNGEWIELTNSVGWFDAESGRTWTPLKVPDGTYLAMRFALGLNTQVNHADVAKFGPEHPLNPNLNGLHWNWQGGYVFLALEGIWRNRGAFDGWSYHLARDTNRVSIELAANLVVSNSTRVQLAFDLANALDGVTPLSFQQDGSSTHSRDGDPVAAALKQNLARAFRVRSVMSIAPPAALNANQGPIAMPKQFTPYRFKRSASFPMPSLPRDNPLIVERVALGEKLFREPLLSRDATLSCASCHDPRVAFSDQRRFSAGVDARNGTRQSMPLLNLAWKTKFFWDGRASSLREQALMPIQDHNEMNESLANVVAKLASREYAKEFQRAFDSSEITPERIGLALEQFVLTLTSFDSKFDRAMRGESELSGPEQRGFELFMTEYDPRRGQFGADCFHCHGGPLFRSQNFANNGLDAGAKDIGRAKVTDNSHDTGKFATPSLRNVALTAPYMHDGRFATLEEVIEHYSSGVERSETLDPNLAKHPDGGLHFSAEDKTALLAFLRALSDPNLEQLAGKPHVVAAKR